MIRTLHRIVIAVLVAPIAIYRRGGWLLLKRRPSCIYLPTCSEYAIEAIEQRGIVVGIALAVSRILRCNPLFHGGYHPVVRARRASPSCERGGASTFGKPAGAHRGCVAHQEQH